MRLLSLFGSDADVSRRIAKDADRAARVHMDLAMRSLSFDMSWPYLPRPTLSLLKTTPLCAYCGGRRGTRRSCDGCGAS